MSNLKINHGAVWVSVILLTGLGFLWYGALFGEKWMALVGLDPVAVEADPPGAGVWITNIVATVIPMYVLAWLFTKLNVDSALKGAKIGLIIAFSFVFLSKMTSDMFAQNPYELSWIVGGFDMAALTIAGIILGAWTKEK
ncbi:DUF1761 domain-containing protein [Roseivirga sp. E12]|uniref:DUF1761 domain-containing protein n=1 Tax=Roseivirga sp. E12 TaxID=2819237 RepID=UPI001ABD2E0E|nr:DUF1761 domain-containing protein [Roseivirga sp. E12]MBO3699905.1 DUF1761 domain-containing protein [Roseivirga sp. E12]